MDREYDGASSRRPRNYPPTDYDDHDAPTSVNDGYRSRRPRGDAEGRSQNPRSQAPPLDQGSSASTDTRPQPRKSILRDSSQPRKPRSNSQVRIKDMPPYEDSDDSNDGWWVTHRDGTREFISDDAPARDKPHRPDLERKTAPRQRRFRDKRDGYASDEGESLKTAKRSSTIPRSTGPRSDPREDDDYYPREGDRRRRGSPDDNTGIGKKISAGATAGAVAGVAAGVAAGAVAAKRHGRGDPDREGRRPPRDDYRDARAYDSEGPAPRRRPRPEGHGDGEPRGDSYRSRRDMDNGAPYDRRPNARPPRDAMNDSNRMPPPLRRPQNSRYDDDYYDDRDYDRGRAAPRPRSLQGRRREADDYYDDRDQYDRRRPPPRARSLERDRDSGRGRDRSNPDDRRRRDGGKNKNGSAWKKQAGTLFMTTALPMIQKEGGKLLRRKLEDMANKK